MRGRSHEKPPNVSNWFGRSWDTSGPDTSLNPRPVRHCEEPPERFPVRPRDGPENLPLVLGQGETDLPVPFAALDRLP